MAGRGRQIEEAFPRLQESPQAAEAEDAPSDGASESSMTPDTEQILWQLLVGDGPPDDDTDP